MTGLPQRVKSIGVSFDAMTANLSVSLEGKVILVTGASRGIGAAIAIALGDAGARVVLASRKQEHLDNVAGLIREALAVATHVGRPEQIRLLFGKAVKAFGKVDGLINNAATNPYFGPMIDCTQAAYDKTLEVNMRGYLGCITNFVRHLRDRQATEGTIVNMASVSGLRGAPQLGVYAMTKAAIISMTQTLAIELGYERIRVNAIAPGLVTTHLSSAIIEDPTLLNPILRRTPLGRYGRPDEITAAALYLSSDQSSFMTGQVMVLDGGLTTR
jgi:NAD(P)-dependent dehydrogenase (short-subunit alcohol dehydrogenase family)